MDEYTHREEERQEHLKYIQKIMDDGYHIVIKNIWPENFSTKMKLNFIDAMIKYYEVREWYERCDKLKELRNIINKEKDG